MAEILTNRNKEKYSHDGFLFTFDKLSADEGTKFWRCDQRDYRQCRVRIHTDLQGNFVRQLHEHNHGSDAVRVEAKKFATGIKRRAVETQEPPCQIRANVMANVPEDVRLLILGGLPSKEASKKLIKRARHEINAPPAIPANLDFEIPEQFRTYAGAAYLLADSGIYQENGHDHRILIFGRHSNGQWAAQMKTVFGDGTFSLAPPNFMQIYVLLAKRGNWVFPVVYALLTTKSRGTYERFFNLVKGVWPDFAPDSLSLDFEEAVIKAAQAVFGEIDLRGCFYHLMANFRKHLGEHGDGDQSLIKRYRTEPAFAILAKMITSISFIPPDHITAAIAVLDQVLPNELQPIIDWFLTNYTGRPLYNGQRTRPKFPVEMWNLYERTLSGADRTNNHK